MRTDQSAKVSTAIFSGLKDLAKMIASSLGGVADFHQDVKREIEIVSTQNHQHSAKPGVEVKRKGTLVHPLGNHLMTNLMKMKSLDPQYPVLPREISHSVSVQCNQN
jgi:hypothetical protein